VYVYMGEDTVPGNMTYLPLIDAIGL
jgi:hypothetical protein